MFSRSHSPNPLISRSVSKKNHQVLDFSTLSDTEKKQYLKLLQKNNVDVAKDPNESLYVAHIKIVKQQHLEQGIQESLRSYTPDLPEDPSSSRPISKQELDSSYRGKSEKRDRSFPATNRSIEENSSRDKPKFISVQTGSSRTLSRGKNQKSSGQLVNQEGLAQYKSIKDARPLSSTKRRPRDERNRDAETFGANQVKAERKFMDRSKSPISDCTKESYNYYLEFFQMANMSACIAYLRPKKIPLESLNKIIEEIFSLQFVQGTSVVKAVVAKKKHQNAPTNSFATFVLNYLKERTVSQPRAVEQNVLNLAYSVYWFRKKSSEIEMFSRFLAGEANDDDLTFFLFLRFNTEKEMNVSLPNYPASPANVIMPVRACYKVLETIYGKYQKDLLNGIIQKVKDFIVEERERKLDFAYDGIPIYSFLLITFEDYLFNKDRCHDSIGFAEEDVINETMEEKEDSHRDMIYYPTTSDYLSHNAPNQHQGQLKNWQTLGMNQKDQYTFNPAKGKNFFTEGDENPEILQKSSSLKNHRQNTKTPEKTSISKVNAPVPSEDNSPPGRKKRGSNPDTQSFSSITSTSGGGLDLLQELCVNLMLEKINEFINVALFERKNVQEAQKELIKARLLDIFRRKFVNIIKALFSYDKTRWLDALLIEEPTTAQLKNIEELQKDLREIKKLTLDSLDKQDIAIFTNKILRTPELSIQIGRLILEFDCDKSGGAKESVY